MDARVAFAIELEQRDVAVVARLEELGALGGEVEALRESAVALRELFERLPGERELLDEQTAEAERALARARDGLAAAADAVERARGEDGREVARREEARATVAVTDAEERLDRLARRRAALEHEAEQSTAEATDLERRAAELAGRLEALPRVSRTAPPGDGLAELAAWGDRAHAAVLVARAGLDVERERIGREANELASSALGEPLYTTSVAQVRRALEERLA